MMKHTISNVKGTIKYNVLIPTFIKSVTINILTVFLELGLPRLKIRIIMTRQLSLCLPTGFL